MQKTRINTVKFHIQEIKEVDNAKRRGTKTN